MLRNTGNNANRIDVRGDGNFISIQNDTVKGYLPFFGERRLSAGPYGGSDVAIKFDEIIEDLEKQINVDKGKIELSFRANQTGGDNENYQVDIEIYPNKNVAVNITPVYRTFMRFTGTLNLKNE